MKMKMQNENPLSSPLSRQRVLYIGNKITNQSKTGLDSIQEPLKLLYSANDGFMSSSGIDAWLAVLPDGLEIEYVEENRKLKFPIQNLHYCAAVRFVNMIGYWANEEPSGDDSSKEKFVPLDNPMANLPTTNHPPIFVAVFRRSKSVKLLECFAFICTTSEAANSFVRFCFHAYADNMYLNMRNENGAQIGKAGELSADESIESRSNDDFKSKDGKSEFKHTDKSENENNCKGGGTVTAKSKANKHWSNVKSKYYNKLQKKTADCDKSTVGPKKLEHDKDIQRPHSPCSTDTKSDSSKDSFWKNRRRRSRSELNLNTIVKNKPPLVLSHSPLPLPFPKGECAVGRICYIPPPPRFPPPEPRYNSIASLIPVVASSVCSVFEVSHVVPQFLKVVPPPMCGMVPAAPVFLCPSPIHQVVVTPAVFHDTDKMSVHKSLYSIPHMENSFEEPAYSSSCNRGSPFLEKPFSSSNTFVQYSSISNIYDNNLRHIGRDRIRSGSNRSKENYAATHHRSRLRENAIYQKGSFGFQQGNEKAAISSMQTRNGTNGIINDFVVSDVPYEVKRCLKKPELYYSSNNKIPGCANGNMKRKSSIEESIRHLNISDGDDGELEI